MLRRMVGLIVVIAVVGLPLAYMIWRFKRGEDAVRRDDDSGPRAGG